MALKSTNHFWAGAWLVATYKAFSEFNLYEPAFDDYEATILAGRSGHFLSSIRQLGQVDAEDVETRRKLAKLKPSEMPSLLARLANLDVLEIERAARNQNAVQFVATAKTSRRWVFESTGKLFFSSDPTEQEQASLFALDLTSVTPLRVTSLRNGIVKRSGFSHEKVSAAIDHLIDCHLLHETRETDRGDSIISNPYAFRSLGEEAGDILSALNQIRPEQALELLEHVKSNPGVPLPPGTDQNVLQVLVHAGLIDHSGIKVRGATRMREFPTIPHLWGVFESGTDKTDFDKDGIDDAKLFLNSIRYGEHYSPSGRGKINEPAILVDRLIRRGEVGPATAIGTDYPLPLSRGIVSIVESRINPGRFHMQLRKKEVAQSVLEILQQGTVLRNHGETADELWGTSGQYQAPETLRITRRLPSRLQSGIDELAFKLRSHRKTR